MYVHVHCIHLARGMMRMRIPSYYYTTTCVLAGVHLIIGKKVGGAGYLQTHLAIGLAGRNFLNVVLQLG